MAFTSLFANSFKWLVSGFFEKTLSTTADRVMIYLGGKIFTGVRFEWRDQGSVSGLASVVIRSLGINPGTVDRDFANDRSIRASSKKDAGFGAFVRVVSKDGVLYYVECNVTTNPEVYSSRTYQLSIKTLQKNKAKLQALIDDSVKTITVVNAPGVYLCNSTGEWEYATTLTPRTFDSLAISEELSAKIREDLRQWKDSKEECIRIGRPHRRTYEFQGMPGTGKTSLARAVATHLNIPLYMYIGIGNMTPGVFTKSLFATPSDCVILIEDYDNLPAVAKRDNVIGDESKKDSKKKDSGPVRISYLDKDTVLNGLDGAVPLTGRVLILSSNTESRDIAVDRDGRIDRIFEVGKSPDASIRKYIAFRYKVDVGEIVTPFKEFTPIVGATLQAVVDLYDTTDPSTIPQCVADVEQYAVSNKRVNRGASS